MIVDAHVHICEPPNDEQGLQKTIWDGSLVQWRGTRANASLDNFLVIMEENEIERAVVIGLEGILSNRYLSEIIEKNEGKFIGFAWVTDPKKQESLKELDKSVKEYGLSGLKLHPSLHGFVPSDPDIIPLVRKAAELNVPVLIHSYPWPPGYFYHNLPTHIDTLKKKVPESTIIIGHMGHLRFQDMIALAPQRGVYVETSWGLTLMASLHGIEFTSTLVKRIGVDNVVYGSDWFGPNGEMERQLELIEKLDLTREEKEKILGDNIRNILSIK